MSYKVYAIKGNSEWCDVYLSLKKGEGRFGWSYIESADLRKLDKRINEEGWGSLTYEEKKCYYPFLLDIKNGDYVIYINIPEWGKCTLARVTGEYYWRFEDKDFNHRFPVDPNSIYIFDRNSNIVHPALSTRLKLQGAWWHIYLKEEFEELLYNLKTGQSELELTSESRLSKEIQPFLREITRKIKHNYPSKSLEDLCVEVLQNVPRVISVEKKGGRADVGADILVKFESGLPITAVDREEILIVQVKSYQGEHWDTTCVVDIKNAFEYYPEASMGLIISTADCSTPNLDKAIDELRNHIDKHVGLLIGEDVARFLLRYGSNILEEL
ncbi:hypothetical protein [Natranaerobius thermophilus]|uniref:Uncharacterized protein n=1 Tax=Natranaerobius thermophilus (strain ATCC BAA-1301 / DSM 18059 / JW/NM-WN-LF) TaxID=457570 RepID=B2A7S5_NATTJ|nr:hypothetical protein [Natranaerobius thermophilus]ACB84377.1 conserved hypothetical protein [Natranaerobius thermophilus JW/NM-WN-LF]